MENSPVPSRQRQAAAGDGMEDDEDDGEWQPRDKANPAFTWRARLIPNPKHSPLGFVEAFLKEVLKADDGQQTLECEVRIQSDDLVMGKVDVLADWLSSNADKHRLGTSNWYDQFVEALCVNGSVEDQGDATFFDLIVHALALPWKLACAVIPPPRLANGWVCFGVTLVLIGMLTALIGDLASVHDLNGLALLSQLRPSLVVVLLNNSGGGIFRYLPIAQHADVYSPYFEIGRASCRERV